MVLMMINIIITDGLLWQNHRNVVVLFERLCAYCQHHPQGTIALNVFTAVFACDNLRTFAIFF
jgi:hypothetical protein